MDTLADMSSFPLEEKGELLDRIVLAYEDSQKFDFEKNPNFRSFSERFGYMVHGILLQGGVVVKYTQETLTK